VLQPGYFRYVKLKGLKLSPEQFRGVEPRIGEVYDLISSGGVEVETQTLIPVRLFDGTHWLSEKTYECARRVLAELVSKSAYEAREGVTFTAAKGAWLVVGEPKPVEPPVGAPRTERYVVVETQLSRSLGLEPFIVEERFLFRGFKGEDVEVGRVARYRYFIAAYNRNGVPLAENELKKTLLWRNYLSRSEVAGVLGGVSEFLRRKFWHLERMGEPAVKRSKVVWRDVAKSFIPAVEPTGAIPDYTVNYVNADSIEEAYYLLAVLLAPQINSVIEELTPWIGHVQPRFIKYFKIPKYNSRNNNHRQLAQIGKTIYERGGVTEEERSIIEKLVETL